MTFQTPKRSHPAVAVARNESAPGGRHDALAITARCSERFRGGSGRHRGSDCHIKSASPSATPDFDSSRRLEPSCNQPTLSRSLIERGLRGQQRSEVLVRRRCSEVVVDEQRVYMMPVEQAEDGAVLLPAVICDEQPVLICAPWDVSVIWAAL